MKPQPHQPAGAESDTAPTDHVCRHPCVICLIRSGAPLPADFALAATERRERVIVTPSTPKRRTTDGADPAFVAAWGKWRRLDPTARAAVLSLIDHLSTAHHERHTRIRERLRLVTPGIATAFFAAVINLTAT